MTEADSERPTRQRILRLIVRSGPVSVVDLAADLDLSTAGVRRHVAALELDGQVTVHTTGTPGRAGPGRPARRYVATERGQHALAGAYADLATKALTFLAETGGEAAVRSFAARRVADLEARLAPSVADWPDLATRVQAVAAGLSADGYAATARPVPGGRAVQLCQGHCPVQEVATEFPVLCEAETEALARLLGVHVQRLSTLAAGAHVCTTHVPLGLPEPSVPTSSVPNPPAATDSRPVAAMEARR